MSVSGENGSFFVVLDLEMCKVQRISQDYGRKMEIIQIGAVLLNEDFDKVNEFDRYVKPSFGYIDRYIHKLTGIKNSDVAKASDLETVLCEFEDWIPDNTANIISWSMTDKNQLYGEMRAKGIHCDSLEKMNEKWIDCQLNFSERMNNQRRYSLEEALIAADIFSIGKAHNGLIDACNTALLYAKMCKEHDFQLNPYYKKAHEYEENHRSHLSYSIGEMLLGLNLNFNYVSC